jgi:hypothetical protein
VAAPPEEAAVNAGDDERPTPAGGHRAGEPVEQPERQRPRGEANFWAALGRLLRRAGRLKALVILAIGLLGGGIAAGAWSGDLVHRPELAAEHDQAEAGRAAIAADVRQLDVRVGRLEASLGYIERVVYQVAVAQGVRNVPPPPSELGAPGN